MTNTIAASRRAPRSWMTLPLFTRSRSSPITTASSSETSSAVSANGLALP